MKRSNLYLVELMFTASEVSTDRKYSQEKSGLMLIEDRTLVEEYVKAKVKVLSDKMLETGCWENIICKINNIEEVDCDFFFGLNGQYIN